MLGCRRKSRAHQSGGSGGFRGDLGPVDWQAESQHKKLGSSSEGRRLMKGKAVPPMMTMFSYSDMATGLGLDDA